MKRVSCGIGFVLFCFPFLMFGQKEQILEKGEVTFVTSQHVYVKFAGTQDIQKGDTLYRQFNEQYQPSLLVKDKSSTSCVCSAMTSEKTQKGDFFYARVLSKAKKEPQKEAVAPSVRVQVKDSAAVPLTPVVVIPADAPEKESGFMQKMKGRISVGSYSNLFGDREDHRMRYTASFQGNHLGNSPVSADVFVSFRHTFGEWNRVKNNLNDALKLYAFNFKYEPTRQISISAGRKINQRFSSIGAMDGLQMESHTQRFSFGALVGARPDYRDYGVNFKLFQAGGYVSYHTLKNNKSQESTLAFIEQRNHNLIDRRFAYFQHTNSLLKNLNLFGSCEVDLFQNVNNEVSQQPRLTNLLLSLRFKASKRLSISTSYDNRDNIIYYESYKSFIDQLLENESRQGLRLTANYRLSKLIFLGTNAGWRFQKSDHNLSKNLYTYLTFSRIPKVRISATVSANILQTPYLNSSIYGLQLSRDILKGKLNVELYGRSIQYDYHTFGQKIKQEVVGANLAWNVSRHLAFFLYFEGTYDKTSVPFNRINSKILHRF